MAVSKYCHQFGPQFLNYHLNTDSAAAVHLQSFYPIYIFYSLLSIGILSREALSSGLIPAVPDCPGPLLARQSCFTGQPCLPDGPV